MESTSTNKPVSIVEASSSSTTEPNFGIFDMLRERGLDTQEIVHLPKTPSVNLTVDHFPRRRVSSGETASSNATLQPTDWNMGVFDAFRRRGSSQAILTSSPQRSSNYQPIETLQPKTGPSAAARTTSQLIDSNLHLLESVRRRGSCFSAIGDTKLESNAAALDMLRRRSSNTFIPITPPTQGPDFHSRRGSINVAGTIDPMAGGLVVPQCGCKKRGSVPSTASSSLLSVPSQVSWSFLSLPPYPNL